MFKENQCMLSVRVCVRAYHMSVCMVRLQACEGMCTTKSIHLPLHACPEMPTRSQGET